MIHSSLNTCPTFGAAVLNVHSCQLVLGFEHTHMPALSTWFVGLNTVQVLMSLPLTSDSSVVRALPEWVRFDS